MVFATFLYLASVRTSVSASPMTPFSFKASDSLNSCGFVILVSGRNVARPKRFFFKKPIMVLAVSSFSVTIFCILPPSAVSIAVSYSLSTLIISATTPIIPLWCSRCSMTFCILFPYPSYRSVRFEIVSSCDLYRWYAPWLSLISSSFWRSLSRNVLLCSSICARCAAVSEISSVMR